VTALCHRWHRCPQDDGSFNLPFSTSLDPVSIKLEQLCKVASRRCFWLFVQVSHLRLLVTAGLILSFCRSWRRCHFFISSPASQLTTETQKNVDLAGMWEFTGLDVNTTTCMMVTRITFVVSVSRLLKWLSVLFLTCSHLSNN
jgi:hypothetical protein